MRLETADAKARFAASPVLRLATVSASGQPHLVPCTFVTYDDHVAIGIDNKPKASTRLKRLANITENSHVSAIADRYDDDWRQLWWVRADGEATILADGAEHHRLWGLLRARYRQYEGQILNGPVIVINVTVWSGWSYA
jgi:PPOX class probable F420-dependent enzyme